MIMTFSCSGPRCSDSRLVAASGEHIIKEDLETMLVSDGWVIVVMYGRTFYFCCNACAANYLAPYATS
jgi:hypothetical protein